MATEVKLPELGDGIESGDVLEIFVAVGDTISAGQDIIEMETDKATVPVPSSVGGKITKISVNEGDTVPVGGVLIEVEAEAGAASPAPPPAEPAPAAPAPEPVTPEPAAPVAPPAGQAPPAPAAPAPVTPAPAAPVSSGTVIPAGPAIRRFAREVGVDLSTVPGSGDHGRITREDVLAVVRSGQRTAPATASLSAAPSAAGATPTPAISKDLPGTVAADDFGPIRVERMSKIRKTISRQMHASWSSVPRVTNFDDADITDLEMLRQSSKEDYAAQGLKLTTMPFLIKAVATALRHHCLLYTSPSPRDRTRSRMPSSA